MRSLWREVKVYSRYNEKSKKHDSYAYVITEAPQGLQIIDLSKLPKSVSLARLDREIRTAHTLFISNVDLATGVALPGLTPYLYLNGANRADFGGAHEGPGRGLTVFDLKNPKNPQIVGEYSDTYVHDAYVQTFTDARAKQCAPGHNPCEVVFAWTGGDFRIIDYTDKKQHVVLGTLIYDNLGYAHSGWISRNQQFLFNFDELDESQSGANTRILTIRISDFRSPQVRGTWTGDGQAIEHNGYVVGNRLFVSHYTRGLVVYDTTNPTRIRETGFFDTFPADDATHFAGAWGVYPYLPSGNILISDIQGGLFVLRPE
jgi:choice-of-anchor B domain-containing protein